MTSLRGHGFIGFLLTAASLLGAENTSPTAVPFPALAAFAAAKNIPLWGVAAPDPAQQVQPGDTLTALITMVEGSDRQQWLAVFEVVPLSPAEQKAPPATEKVFTSTGNEFDFNSRPAALALRMYGPFAERGPSAGAGEVAEKTARLVVQEGFLRFGFARFSELVLGFRETHKEFPFHVAGVPLPADLIAREKPQVLAVGLTREDEEAIAEINPAINQFLNVAEHTPGLSELVFKVMNLPPFWSLLTGGNTGFDLNPKPLTRFDTADWDMPASRAYRYPFVYTLNGTRAVQGVFFFAPPARPLQACAGIIGLIAQSPKHPGIQLELRVLAAHRAVGSQRPAIK